MAIYVVRYGVATQVDDGGITTSVLLDAYGQDCVVVEALSAREAIAGARAYDAGERPEGVHLYDEGGAHELMARLGVEVSR